MKLKQSAIGVLGGLGPYAGLDLAQKIFDQTQAQLDQEHLPLLLFSLPGCVGDRTRFLFGETEENPGEAIGEIMVHMARAGATVIGMACNMAHSPRILGVALQRLRAKAPKVRFIHMIDAVAEALHERTPSVTTVGMLTAKGTYRTGIYQNALQRAGYTVLFPDAEGRERVQQAISHPQFGIKAHSRPVTPDARLILVEESEKLIARGAQTVILGCTEIPLALTEPTLRSVPLLDATHILARAMIRAFAPERLREF